MNKKIRITVCCGTTCHLMGSSEILIYKDELEAKFNHQVEVYGSPCLGNCKNYAAANAPYVLIGDKLISQANMKKITDYLTDILNIEE